MMISMCYWFYVLAIALGQEKEKSIKMPKVDQTVICRHYELLFRKLKTSIIN